MVTNLTNTFSFSAPLGSVEPVTSVSVRKGTVVRCAKQITFCHVEVAAEELHPFCTQEISFVPAFHCGGLTGPATTIFIGHLGYHISLQTVKSN